MAELVMLKLGGSLITNKTRPYTSRPKILAELAHQIKHALDGAATTGSSTEGESPRYGLQLLIGHGSGSFGHQAAMVHRTYEGIARTPADLDGDPKAYWRGFAEVRFRVAQLNSLVMEALHRAGIAAMAFPPSSGIIARDRQVLRWDVTAMKMSLLTGIIPVVFGDVVFDEVLGGTILSTEDLFAYLARQLRPSRILLAGIEPGVWSDFPGRTSLLDKLTPATLKAVTPDLAGSMSVDVTGGMASKVQQMLELTEEIEDLEVLVFSGERPGAVERALLGEHVGTALRAK